jgi:hypothetical protein
MCFLLTPFSRDKKMPTRASGAARKNQILPGEKGMCTIQYHKYIHK